MDYAPIEAFLVGRCGKTRYEAGWVSVEEYMMLRDGLEKEQRERWEIARWQMFMVMQMHPMIKAQNKPKRVEDWVRFPWEAEDKVKDVPERIGVTEEEVNELERIFNELKR